MAGSGDSATTYGLGPLNTGSAMALSPFQPDAWAAYYNPAALARSSEGQLVAVLQNGDQELRAESLGGSDPLERDGDVLHDRSSELALLGLKTNLSGTLSNGEDYSFALNIGIDEYGNNYLPFNAQTTPEGQFLRYDTQPLYLALGGAKKDLLRGIDLGLGARVSLNADANVTAVSDLAGETHSESLQLQARPSFTPSLGLNIKPRKLFCGSDTCLPGLLNETEVALFWRDDSDWGVNVNANVVIPGTIPEPGIDLSALAIDSFQPEVLGGALWLPVGGFDVSVSVEQQRWSELERRFSEDTIRDQADLRFDDIIVPRVGVRYQWSGQLALVGGVSVEESPLKGRTSQDINFLDSDRKLAGIGASYLFRDFPVIALPMEVGFGYQYQKLDEREFDLTSRNSPSDPEPFETVRADGEIHVFSGSIELKF